MTYQEILSLGLEDFLNYLDDLQVRCPEQVENMQDMYHSGKILAKISNNYSMTQSLLSRAAILKRYFKTSKQKEMYEEMIDKMNAIENTSKALNLAYQAVRSGVTIHMKDMEEMKFIS